MIGIDRAKLFPGRSFRMEQEDALAALAAAADWNCIHPDFRGPNISPEACLSDLVVSEGGHAACGMVFLKSRRSFRRLLASGIT